MKRKILPCMRGTSISKQRTGQDYARFKVLTAVLLKIQVF